MNSQVIPWPEEGMTVADLVKLLQTLPPTYKVEGFGDYNTRITAIKIDDKKEIVNLAITG